MKRKTASKFGVWIELLNSWVLDENTMRPRQFMSEADALKYAKDLNALTSHPSLHYSVKAL